MYGVQLLRYSWRGALSENDTAFLGGLRVTEKERIETVLTTPFITDDLDTAVEWVGKFQLDEMLANPNTDVGWYRAQGDSYSWESNDGRIMAITIYTNVLFTKNK